jgi:adenylylsulfate kinase-like enzyme
MEKGEFVEIYINAPIEVCISRDPKGLYKKAERREIKNFTGIDSRYDIPKDPEIIIDSGKIDSTNAADKILLYLEQNNYLSRVD